MSRSRRLPVENRAALVQLLARRPELRAICRFAEAVDAASREATSTTPARAPSTREDDMGNIGQPEREYEFPEPVPATQPVTEPAQPEKVPA